MIRTPCREVFDDGSFERRNLRGDCAVLQFDVQADCAEMRQPVELLVWLEEMELLRVRVLDSRRSRVSTANLGNRHATYSLNWPGMLKLLVCSGGQKCRDTMVGCRGI